MKSRSYVFQMWLFVTCFEPLLIGSEACWSHQSPPAPAKMSPASMVIEGKIGTTTIISADITPMSVTKYKEGDELELSCSLRSKAAKIQWIHLVKNDWIFSGTESTSTRSINMTLLEADDGTQLACVARSEANSRPLNNYKLSLQMEPGQSSDRHAITKSKTQEVEIGLSYTKECSHLHSIQSARSYVIHKTKTRVKSKSVTSLIYKVTEDDIGTTLYCIDIKDHDGGSTRYVNNITVLTRKLPRTTVSGRETTRITSEAVTGTPVTESSSITPSPSSSPISSSTSEPPPSSPVPIAAIVAPTVIIVIGLISLAVYIVMKRRRIRASGQPPGPNNASPPQVIYAELQLAEQTRELNFSATDRTPYAEVIGVLAPEKRQ